MLERPIMLRWSAPLVVVAACAGCAATDAPRRRSEPPAPRVEGLRSGADVSAALRLAEKAYLAGDWGETVVQANRVMEGVAAPDEYYAAVKLLGLASCSRRDLRPAVFAQQRLQPEDRDQLQSVCEENGLKLPPR
jgi:hypothetical protein